MKGVSQKEMKEENEEDSKETQMFLKKGKNGRKEL